jgi:arylsulfatase
MNCLVIVLDAFHAEKSSLYGYPEETTPYLDKWAKEGVVFEEATSQFTQTSSSSWSYLNGLYPYHSMPYAPMREGDVPLAQVFRDNGYRTAGITDNPFISKRFGMDRGFTEFQYHKFDEMSIHEYLDSTGEDAEQQGLGRNQMSKFLFDETSDWILEDDSQPWFAYVHTLRPHAPYAPEEPFLSAFLDEDLSRNQDDILSFEAAFRKSYLADGTMPDPSEIKLLHDLYLANIRYVDDLLNTLLTKLKNEGRLENTLVVITSDHGEAFGQHGEMLHGGTPYREQNHVPLIVIPPASLEIETGSIAVPVELLDLMPTLTEVCDLNDTVRRDGQSLVPLMERRDGYSKDVMISQSKSDLAVVRNGHKLIFRSVEFNKADAPSSRLFDLENDPTEQNNLYPGNEMSSVLIPIAQKYLNAQVNQESIVIPTLSDEERELLESLGYFD